MTSVEFIREAVQNKTGKNAGLRSVCFNGKRHDRQTGRLDEYVKPQFQKYVATDFSRIRGSTP